jgi:putative tricarboxylic transport membrane protein
VVSGTEIVAGLLAALTLEHVLYAFVGALVGTVVGLLPGLGPVATIALLLPVTFSLAPTGAIIMLAGIYYGAQYGSSTTAILLNLPGECSAAVTAVQGHALARSGHAMEALAVASLASAVAGFGSALVVAVATPGLARLSLAIGPADVAALMLLAAVLVIVLADASWRRGVAMLAIGGMLGLIGTAGPDGRPRFVFGIDGLHDGIGMVPLIVGLFGLSEVMGLAARGLQTGARVRIGPWWPSWQALRGWFRPAARGTVIGAAVGLVPGATTLFAAFVAYAAERRIRHADPHRHRLAGVAAPEAANNAAAQTSFVALFGLGLPANAVTAVLIGAMMIHGLPAGPALFQLQPQVFWTFVGSMLVANVMLVVLNLPLVGLWARLLMVSPVWLVPTIVVVACVGVLATMGTTFDVLLMAGFGLAGYALRRGGYPLLPLLIGFVLTPIFEDHLRRAIAHARGDLAAMVGQPLTLTLLATLLGVLVAAAVLRRRGAAGNPQGARP